MPQLPLETQITTMCPEVELLLCCARTNLNAQCAIRINALLQKEIEWTYLKRMTYRHGVVPLLYSNLRSYAPEAVPQPAINQLQNFFQTNTRRNFLLVQELSKLLKLLDMHRIPAIPFKGPVLATSIYGNLALRQFIDLDILVHIEDILRAREVLISQGYRLADSLTEDQETNHLQTCYDYKLVRDDIKIRVELHWAFTPDKFLFSLDVDEVWERAKPISLGGMRVRSLLPEDLLLILCVHLASHCWRGTERLKWVCDIAELIRVYPELDWERIVEQASRLRSRRMLFLGLLLAYELLGTDLPEEIRRRIQADSVVKLLAGQVGERLFSETDGRLKGVERYLFYFRVRESWRDKTQRFLYFAYSKATPNEKDRAFVPLPQGLSFVYWLFRPLRLVREYGLSPLKHLLRHLVQYGEY